MLVPSVSVQWPTVTEYDGLAGAPILVKDLGAVLGGNRRHTLSLGEVTGWSRGHPDIHSSREVSVFPGRGIFALLFGECAALPCRELPGAIWHQEAHRRPALRRAVDSDFGADLSGAFAHSEQSKMSGPGCSLIRRESPTVVPDGYTQPSNAKIHC